LKDFSNPITRFAMQDYPEDGGQGMSQAHHGEKMTTELPSELKSPAVRVKGQIFFIHELLQRASGAYFIPTQFFYKRSPSDGLRDTASEKDLFALGYDVFESIVS
jgi:hypothetical protein